jgi:hypothetical protein
MRFLAAQSSTLPRLTPSLLALLLVCASQTVWAGSSLRPAQQAAMHQAGIFHAGSTNTWNRLHRCLLLRKVDNGAEYGDDTLDPLLWDHTKHLLTDDSHQHALDCLDEFLRSHGEQEVHDPLERAIFEHDLWAIFDWSARSNDHPQQRRALQLRLAEVLRRVALTADQIHALPDTYQLAIKSARFSQAYDPANPQRAFLPRDLFLPRGPWVCIASRGGDPVAIAHVTAFSGRSRFMVFLRLPEGRSATLQYLHKLWTFPDPLMVPAEHGLPGLNPLAPQFPPGTMVALVRQMILFDRDGKLESTPLTESVQLRVYRTITPGSRAVNFINGPASKDQDFFEYQLRRSELFHGKTGGLVAVASDQKEFLTFLSHGEDPFELAKQNVDFVERYKHVILKSCTSCHADAGIHSVQSRFRLVKPNEDQLEMEALDPVYGAIYWETEDTLAWKQRHYDWGLLNGFWQAAIGSAEKPGTQ